MKTWQRVFSVVLIVVAVYFFNQDQTECCLCSSFRLHAPCLVDLKTGQMIELDLYVPHPTKVAELAEEQPQVDIFSFVELGDAMGTKETERKVIEIDIPIFQKTINPALCKACQKQVGGIPVERYMLADLYSEKKTLVPIHDGLSMVLRCYEITVQKTEEGILKIMIQGLIE